MRKVMLIAMAACALSACGSSNNNNNSSSSSSGGSGSSSGGSSGGSSGSGSSSSSGGSSSGSPAQGIYCGSFTGLSSSSSSGASSGSSSSGSGSSSSSSGTTSSFCSSGSSASNFFGLVQADGSAELFGKSGSVFILFQPAAKSLTSTSISSVPVTAYGLDGTTVNGAVDGTDSGSLSGTVTPGTLLTGTSISGTLTDSHGISLNFSATANSADWNSAASLSTVAGSYTGSFSLGSSSYSPSLTITATGGISGSDNAGNGCTYTGQVTVADASHNDYGISLASSCVGTFNGLGAYFSGANNPGGLLAPDVFKMGLVNSSSSNAIYLSLSK